MLLKTGAAGFCHTDELIRTGGMPVSLKHNLIGGHEPAGTVVDLGKDAAKAGWYIGQRVGALGYMGYCGMYYLLKRKAATVRTHTVRYRSQNW